MKIEIQLPDEFQQVGIFIDDIIAKLNCYEIDYSIESDIKLNSQKSREGEQWKLNNYKIMKKIK